MKFKFNDFEAEFDNTDVDFLEKYVAQLEKLADAAKKMDTVPAGAETFKIGNAAVNNFFNALFGGDAAAKMFGARKSYKEHLRAMVELRKGVLDTAELEAINTEIKTLAERQA